MTISHLKQLEAQRQILERLNELKEHRHWSVFEQWLKARLQAVKPKDILIQNQDHALQIASNHIYAQAIHNILEDLNALDVSIQTINQEIEKHQ